MNDIINILNQVRIVSRKIKEQRKEKFERVKIIIFSMIWASCQMKSIYTLCFW